MKKDKKTRIKAAFRLLMPHLLVGILFFSLTIFFFYPVFFQNKQLQQGDIQEYRSSVQGIAKYEKETGQRALWNPWLFSGMPSRLGANVEGYNVLSELQRLTYFHAFPHPVWIFFVALLWSYILLICFKIRPVVAFGGSLIYVFSSYFLIGLGAGHNARMAAIAYIPMMLAGVHLAYGKKRVAGICLVAFGTAFQLQANHVQITYYALFALLFYATWRAFTSYKEQKLRRYLISTACLLFAGFLGFSTYYARFSSLYKYSKYSTRGTNILSDKTASQAATEAPKDGLKKDYAFEYSNTIMESMTLLVPNFYGGQMKEPLGRNSHVIKALRKNKAPISLSKYAYTYRGAQPITTPYYAGAVAFFLLMLGIFSKEKHRYWLLALGIFALFITWGKHLAWFNYFLFETLPGFNKFRSPTFITIVILLVYAVLGGLGLERALGTADRQWWRSFWAALGASGGTLALVLLFSGLGNYEAPIDGRLRAAGIPSWFLTALEADRLALLRADAWRSLLFVLSTATVIALIARKTWRTDLGSAAIVLLIAADLGFVTTRYFTPTKNYKKKTVFAYSPTEVDQILSKDTSLHYRIFPMTSSFHSNRGNGFTPSVGGYHAAKLRRYQDLIEHGLAPERAQLQQTVKNGKPDLSHLPISDMLNVKYFVFGTKKGQVLRNDSPCGAAWLVDSVLAVRGPDQEIAALRHIVPQKVAVQDTLAFELKQDTYDATGTVKLLQYTPNEVRYKVKNAGKALLVMSEIHYPAWKAYVDDEPGQLLRVNYLLRALVLPPGEHEVRLEIALSGYSAAKNVTLAGNIGLLLLLGLAIGLGLRRTYLYFYLYEENEPT